MTRESAIEKHLRLRIERIGGECFKFKSPGRRGLPDRLVIVPGGEITWVELKAERGTLSPPQQRVHFRLKELVQTVKVFWSTDQIDRHFPLEEEEEEE